MLLCFSLHLDVYNHYSPHTSKLPCPSPRTTYIRPFQLYQLQFYSNVMMAQLVNDMYIYIELAMHQILFLLLEKGLKMNKRFVLLLLNKTHLYPLVCT